MLLPCKAGSAAVQFVNRICVSALRLSPWDICLFVRMWRKDTRVTDMIMWFSQASAITTQLNTQSLTG